MFNVIFYEDLVTKTVTDENGNEVRTFVCRVPSKYVCTTLRTANNFFLNAEIEKFVGSMPALVSATSMFEGSKIKTIHDVKLDESGIEVESPADFDNVSDAYRMFADCEDLTSVNIDMNTLISINSTFAGCSSLTSFSGSMNGLENGSGMFVECPNLTTFTASVDKLQYGDSMFRGTKISSIDVDFNSLETATEMFAYCSSLTSLSFSFPLLKECDGMFRGSALTSISLNIPSAVLGSDMFNGCSSLTSVSGDFSAIRNGDRMFYGCKAMGSLKLNLPSLERAYNMFSGNAIFTRFEGNLHNLVDGTEMFYQSFLNTFITDNLDSLIIGKSMFKGCKIRNWSIDMPSLMDGSYMFESNYHAADNNQCLQNFKSNLDSLTNGVGMFKDCKRLSGFNAALPSLENGTEMFMNCKLDATSVMYIVETLPHHTSGNHAIGIGVNADSSTIETFVKEMGVYSNWAALKQRLSSKGWSATWYDSSGNVLS